MQEVGWMYQGFEEAMGKMWHLNSKENRYDYNVQAVQVHPPRGQTKGTLLVWITPKTFVRKRYRHMVCYRDLVKCIIGFSKTFQRCLHVVSSAPSTCTQLRQTLGGCMASNSTQPSDCLALGGAVVPHDLLCFTSQLRSEQWWQKLSSVKLSIGANLGDDGALNLNFGQDRDINQKPSDLLDILSAQVREWTSTIPNRSTNRANLMKLVQGRVQSTIQDYKIALENPVSTALPALPITMVRDAFVHLLTSINAHLPTTQQADYYTLDKLLLWCDALLLSVQLHMVIVGRATADMHTCLYSDRHRVVLFDPDVDICASSDAQIVYGTIPKLLIPHGGDYYVQNTKASEVGSAYLAKFFMSEKEISTSP
jgi:hypothetical protein